MPHLKYSTTVIKKGISISPAKNAETAWLLLLIPQALGSLRSLYHMDDAADDLTERRACAWDDATAHLGRRPVLVKGVAGLFVDDANVWAAFKFCLLYKEAIAAAPDEQLLRHGLHLSMLTRNDGYAGTAFEKSGPDDDASEPHVQFALGETAIVRNPLTILRVFSARSCNSFDEYVAAVETRSDGQKWGIILYNFEQHSKYVMGAALDFARGLCERAGPTNAQSVVFMFVGNRPGLPHNDCDPAAADTFTMCLTDKDMCYWPRTHEVSHVCSDLVETNVSVLGQRRHKRIQLEAIRQSEAVRKGKPHEGVLAGSLRVKASKGDLFTIPAGAAHQGVGAASDSSCAAAVTITFDYSSEVDVQAHTQMRAPHVRMNPSLHNDLSSSQPTASGDSVVVEWAGELLEEALSVGGDVDAEAQGIILKRLRQWELHGNYLKWNPMFPIFSLRDTDRLGAGRTKVWLHKVSNTREGGGWRWVVGLAGSWQVPALAAAACAEVLGVLDALALGQTAAVGGLLEGVMRSKEGAVGSPLAGLRRVVLDMLCFLASELRLEVISGEDEELQAENALVHSADAFDVREAEFKLWVLSDAWHEAAAMYA